MGRREKMGSSEGWLGFAAYPEARELCRQRVYGTRGEEIHWRAYATTDATSDVIAFYAKAESANAEKSATSIRVKHGSDKVLSVHPASAADSPRCDTPPGLEHQTVIIVSQMFSRR